MITIISNILFPYILNHDYKYDIEYLNRLFNDEDYKDYKVTLSFI